MKLISFTLMLMLISTGFSWLDAQDLALTDQRTGPLRGYVRSADGDRPLVGALIQVLNLSPMRTVRSDEQGYFILEDLPIGRYRLSIEKEGYRRAIMPDILVNSHETAELEIVLEAQVQARREGDLLLPEAKPELGGSVNRSAKTSKDQAHHPLSDLAARRFTVEEVFRYPGSRLDPSHLAANFAGVSLFDDARNDMVVRANSPHYLQWQMEELPIENLNHITVVGRSGGTTPIVSLFALGKADFVKSHFGPQYGSASAGVFDLQLREGNKKHFSGLVQLGLQQTQLVLEGPLKGKEGKKLGSFLVTGRLATGGYLFKDWIPTDPESQDLNFKLQFERGKFGHLEFFGLLGRSGIYIPYDQGSILEKNRYLIFENQDYDHRNRFALLGAKHTKYLGQHSFFRTVLGVQHSFEGVAWDNVNPQDLSVERSYTVANERNRILLHSYWQTSPHSRSLWRMGLMANICRYDLNEFSNFFSSSEVDFEGWEGTSNFYLHHRWSPREDLRFHLGGNLLYNSINNEFRPQIKFSSSWDLKSNQTLLGGYALNYQAPTAENFFFNPIVAYDDNGEAIYDYRGRRNLQSMQVQQADLEYRWRVNENWRFSLAAYGQWISGAIVEGDSSSIFSTINSEEIFYPFYYGLLKNAGKGQNLGLEATIEKFFSHQYYLLFSGALFDSRYQAYDGQWRETVFANRYIVNFLVGKEFSFGSLKQHAFFADLRFSTRGGRPYRPIDAEATYALGFQSMGTEPVFDDDLAYRVRTPAFYQLDVKLGMRLNSFKTKTSHQIRLEVFNALNRPNVFSYQYSTVFNPFGQAERGEVLPIYQRGFIPDLVYLVQF